MTADIRVTGICLTVSDKDRAHGILARFDCILGPVVLTGCGLKRNPGGKAVAILPKSYQQSVRMLHDKDHAQLCRLAGEAYGAMTAAAQADDG